MDSGTTLGVIGAGNLGGALAGGALSAGVVSRVFAADVSKARLAELSDELGSRFTPSSVAAAVHRASLVVVAVKPHIVPDVLRKIRPALREDCPVISVAAGVPIRSIGRQLPPQWPVIRCMPNLAMLVGESATAVAANEFAEPRHVELVDRVFGAVGTVAHVEERQMHAVTGLSGSGPAYVSLILEGLAAGGVQTGLAPGLAMQLACQLLLGTAKLLAENGLHPAQLKDQVTTPAGTTIAGLKELELRGVRGALLAAVEAASERSEQLGGE